MPSLLERMCLTSAFPLTGVEREQVSAQTWHILMHRCNQEGAEERNASVSSPQITANSHVIPSNTHTQPHFNKISFKPWLEVNWIYADDLSSCLAPALVFCYSWHTFMQCTRVSFASAAEANGEIHLTTWAHCTSWKCCGIAALPIKSVGRFGGKLLIQQMEICDAVSNRCVSYQSTH